MKYLLMMHSGARYEIFDWAKADIETHSAFMRRMNKQLAEAGELVTGAGLTGPEQAKRVRAGADGAPVVDGVFPETKEFLAGGWVIDVDTPERAYAIAAEISLAPGPGGTPLHMTLEVRQVMFEIDPRG